MPRIALLGGSFNPPHLGHLLLADVVLETCDIDEVWWLPVGGHAFGKDLPPWTIRAGLVERTIAGRPGMRLCAEEASVEGPSYTVETVERLRARHPDHQFHWVGGADLSEQLPRWHRWQDLAAMVPFILVGRGAQAAALPDGARGTAVDIQLPAISSSEVRSRIAAGLGVQHLLPRAVFRALRDPPEHAPPGADSAIDPGTGDGRRCGHQGANNQGRPRG